MENSGQIADASDITVNANATLDFNGHDDTVGSMDIDGGAVTAGAASVTLDGVLTFTGGSVTTQSDGSIQLGGDVAVNDAPSVATIDGNLDLGGAVRAFDVAHDAANAVDLQVDAVLSDGGIIEEGTGVMAFSGANTFAGTQNLWIDGSTVAVNFEIRAGTVEAESDDALGAPTGTRWSNPAPRSNSTANSKSLRRSSSLGRGSRATSSGPPAALPL